MLRDAKRHARRFESIIPDEAVARSDLLVLDVRRPEELTGELGAIEGALNCPLPELLSDGPPDDLDQRQPVLLVCRSGARSSQAALALAALGYVHVYNLHGGMIAWCRAGHRAIRRQHAPV